MDVSKRKDRGKTVQSKSKLRGDTGRLEVHNDTVTG